MQSIKRFIFWLAMNSTFSACAYFGYLEGNENAKNIMQFLVFFVTLPISLIVLTDKFAQNAAASKDKGPNPILRLISRWIGIFVLGCFAWSGSFITAAVWVFWMLARLAATENIKKFKEKAGAL